MSTEDVETVTVSLDVSAFREAMAGVRRSLERYEELRRPVVDQIHADAVAAYRSWAGLCQGLSGAIQEAARREADILRFLQVADAYGVDESTARGIVDETLMEAERSPYPWSIDAAYVRLFDHAEPTPESPVQFLDWGRAPSRRRPGESRIDATERVLSSCSYGADTATFDSRPEHCWRCDARGAQTDVGLCTSCHDDLRTP
jgi:hypothetical protein